MKKARTIVALLLCALLLIGASVAGTMAYLTFRTNEVTNTFTIGKVEIKLDEEGATERDDQTVGLDLHLVPNVPVDKEPVVTVLKDSEDCYVRVKVTVDVSESWKPEAAKAAGWMTDGQDFADVFRNWALLFAENYFRTGIMVGFNTANWKLVKTNINSDNTTITYYINYRNSDSSPIVPKSATDTKLPAVFEQVVAPADLTKDQLALLQGMKIKVEAHAIQAEGFTETETGGVTVTAEQNAWEKFGN